MKLYKNSKIEIYVGMMEEDIEQEITYEPTKLYKPFIQTFKSLEEFIKWNATKRKPILKGAWYVRIYEDISYNMFISNLNTLKEQNLDYVYLQYMVKPKDRYAMIKNLSDERVEIHSIFEVKKDIINKTLNEILEVLPIEDEQRRIKNMLLSRVGYNLNLLRLYAYKVVNTKDRGIKNLKKIIPNRKAPSMERVLWYVLKKDKRFTSEYYKICERYSTDWVNSYMENLLQTVIENKKKIKTKETTYFRLRENDYIKGLVPIIRDIPLSDVLTLLICLRRYKLAGVEAYLKTNPQMLMNKLVEDTGIGKYELEQRGTVISYE